VLGVNSVKSGGDGVVIATAVKNKKEIQSERMATANGLKKLWIKVALDNVDLNLPYSAPDEYCRQHIE
jgi:hypothetical protein